MKDVLYEDLYSVHMLLDQPKAQSFARYNQYTVYGMYAYRAAEKAAALHRCNGSTKDVLYEDLYSVYMHSDQPKAQSLPKI